MNEECGSRDCYTVLLYAGFFWGERIFYGVDQDKGNHIFHQKELMGTNQVFCNLK